MDVSFRTFVFYAEEKGTFDDLCRDFEREREKNNYIKRTKSAHRLVALEPAKLLSNRVIPSLRVWRFKFTTSFCDI